MRRTAIIQRAGYGDIINILPMAKIIAEQEGEPPTMFVSSDKIGFLDGCSYVKGAVASQHLLPYQLQQSLQSRFGRVLLSDVCGNGITYERRCESFTKEAWDRCGMLPYWGRAHPPEFDLRDADRERVLIDRHLSFVNKPLVLVNLCGKSAPFRESKRLINYLLLRHGGDCHILNMAVVKAAKLFDLIGLFERAHLMVTIDTSTLHLAAASSVPVIALTSDTPGLWHGTVLRKHPLLSLRYREVMSRIYEISALITRVTGTIHGVPHVYSDFHVSNIAEKTWRATYGTSALRSFPVLDSQLLRLFQDGPTRRLPFVRDMIDLAFQAEATNYIMLTNSDTLLAPKMRHFTELIEKDFSSCLWGQRRDFDLVTEPLEQWQVNNGEQYSGTDLFVISRSWWRQFRNMLPDLLLGAEGWDCCYRELARISGGSELKDCCYHERHESFWERAENRYTLPSQKHNQALSKVFLRSIGVDPVQHGFK